MRGTNDGTHLIGLGPVDAARCVVERKTYAKVDGVLLDAFTASAIVACADALGPERAKQLNTFSLVGVATMALKVVRAS